ncbi:MAG: hypothetical protein WB420_15060, partial [Bradyrhizobium sp.]
ANTFKTLGRRQASLQDGKRIKVMPTPEDPASRCRAASLRNRSLESGAGNGTGEHAPASVQG